jgi:hypothetical protein
MWPANPYARFLWLALDLWEDLHTLVDVYKSTNKEDPRLVIARHTLVDFDSLDELLKEFIEHINKEEIKKLNQQDQDRLLNACISYHKAVQPRRKLLKDIRNNLGAHRTGRPWINAPQSGISSSSEYGKWEQFLAQLENKCDLNEWVNTFNAVYQLLNVLQDFNLDAWYSWPENENIKFYMPILPAGYYPKKQE